MASGNPQNTSQSIDTGDESQSSQSKRKAGKKGNSGSSKKMTDKEQSEQFIKTARELDADESGGEFDITLSKIISTAK